MLEKVKHYKSDFYDYDVPRIKKKFGITDGELYYYGKNEFEKLLNPNMTSSELDSVIPY